MRALLFLILILVTPMAHAVAVIEPPPTDQSLMILRNIFGEVPNVLELGGSELLKGVLVNFNNAVLILGGIIIIYSLLVSTINTANEGEMLGKNWNSVWIPMRAAFGFSLLLPVKANSYALIQVFVMWVIVQGVGAADMLWTNGVQSIQTGTAAYVPTASPSVINAAQMIFQSKVCEKQAAAFLKSTPREVGRANSTPSRMFGVAKLSSDPAICGAANYKYPANTPEDKAANNALDTMINNLDSAATLFINSYNTGDVDLYTQYRIQNQVKSAAETYNSTLTSPSSQSTASLNQKLNQKLEVTKAAGWITAGSYFLDISQAANDNIAASIQGPSVSQPDVQKLSKKLFPDDFNKLAQMLQYIQTQGVATPADQSLSGPEGIMGWITKNILNPIKNSYMGFLKAWQSGVTGGTGTSPILAISDFGSSMANNTAAGYMILAFSISIMEAAASSAFEMAKATAMIPFFGAGAIPLVGILGGLFKAMTVIIMYLTPAILSILGALFLSGLTMGYYVPLIPYLIFTLTAIGWIILTIEAMVAAPLMAIGILHPEGQHQIFGRAERGIMILAGVFLRPSLMIVGFFASILVSYAAVGLVNMGFLPVADHILNVSPFGLIFIIVMYTMLVLIALNKSFSLIYHIPDHIMRWIGEQGEQSAVEKEMGELRGGADKAGQETSGGVTGVGDVERARQEEKRAKRRKERDKRSKALKKYGIKTK